VAALESASNCFAVSWKALDTAGATFPSVKEKARAIKTDTKAIRVEYSVRAWARLRLLVLPDGIFLLLSGAVKGGSDGCSMARAFARAGLVLEVCMAKPVKRVAELNSSMSSKMRTPDAKHI